MPGFRTGDGKDPQAAYYVPPPLPQEMRLRKQYIVEEESPGMSLLRPAPPPS